MKKQMRKWTKDEIKEMWTAWLDGESYEAISFRFHRTAGSIITATNIIKSLKNATTAELPGMIKRYKSSPLFVEFANSLRLLPQNLQNEVNLDQAVEEAVNDVNELFAQMQDKVINLATLVVKQKLQDQQEQFDRQLMEKDAEIKSLKTVVEAAKKNNIAHSLKQRLMGGL